MKKRKPTATGYTENFGDDFEVTYTEELPAISLDFDDEDREAPPYEYEKYTQKKKSPKKPEYREHMRKTEQPPQKSRRDAPHRKQTSSDELAAPLEGPVRASTLIIEKLTYFILRPAPAICAAVITLVTIVSFWNGHGAFGEISSLSEGNAVLASYLVVGGILLFWELSSFLFALSGFSSGTGRGLTFFILVYVGSYLASVADRYLPEELILLEGVKGGLTSFGSLYPMLFPFCVVGFITCLLKNFLAD